MRRGGWRRALTAKGSAANNSLRDVSGLAVQGREIGRVEFHHHPAAAPSVVVRSVGRRPPHAGAFQDRCALRELVDLFADDSAAGEKGSRSRWRGGTAVLRGIGGAGKTQVAAEYVRRMRESGDADVLVWVEATSRDTVLHGLSRAAAEILGADDHDVRQAADRFLDWLDGTDEHWLVVYDDLRDSQDLHGLWPPDTPYGQLVVTTRCRDVAFHVNGADVIEVEPFTPEEAVAFLTDRLAGGPGQSEGAAELAKTMGYHPLGLAQAATYIAERRDMTCVTYRELFDSRRRTLACLRPDRLPDGHEASIEATWSLSIERANQVAPHRLAVPLLTAASMLHSHGVPSVVFRSVAMLDYVHTARRRAVDEQDVRDALSCLHRFGLITYDPDTPHQSVRVHALVQRVVYDSLARREVTRTAQAMAEALVRAWPAYEGDHDLASVLRANAMALRKSAGLRLVGYWTRALSFRVGRSLGDCGQAAAARDHFWELAEVLSRKFGPKSRFTLSARVNHAHWQGEAGDALGAVRALAQLIREAPRTFAFQRKLRMKARRAYARWLTDAGGHVRAVGEADAMVDDFRRVFGPDHLETLYALNVQARCLGAAGRPQLAVDIMTPLIEGFGRLKGPDDLDTLSARNNLAGMYSKVGDCAHAISAYTDLLPDLYRVLGPNHPKTLRTRNNLAWCRIEVGEYADVVPGIRQLVADCDRVLGPAHPETLVAWSNLSTSFAKACEPQEPAL